MNEATKNKINRLEEVIAMMNKALKDDGAEADGMSFHEWAQYFEESIEAEGLHISSGEIAGLAQFMAAVNQDDKIKDQKPKLSHAERMARENEDWGD